MVGKKGAEQLAAVPGGANGTSPKASRNSRIGWVGNTVSRWVRKCRVVAALRAGTLPRRTQQ
jgi:hypothetical protein